MTTMHYIGFVIHKKVISFCEKRIDGEIVDQGMISATREALSNLVETRKQIWVGAMEATLFTGWIYDYLLPFAQDLKVAHPEMLKAITASKKKNDATDAEKIADLLRCNLLPECYMPLGYSTTWGSLFPAVSITYAFKQTTIYFVLRDYFSYF